MATRQWIETDLAPGDRRAGRLDIAQLELRAIHSIDEPAFLPAYGFLERVFGSSGALESIDVLARRFTWPGGPQEDGWALRYEMLAVLDATGNLAAVRDHTAAVPPADAGSNRSEAIVHLSHALVAPEWRRSGLGGWLRALPLQVARDLLRATSQETRAPAITLVAEMEAPSSAAPVPPASLLAYEKAGFHKLDPAQVSYFQPDFRAPAAIDRDGGPRPLPFSLVIRQVGREHERELTGAQARSLARALYRVYHDGCRTADLSPLLAAVDETYPGPQERVRLVPPSAP
jgi:GNAT superfamily N-acetyltransferase